MGDNNLSKLRLIWIIWLFILVLSAFAIPYLFLGGIEKISGAFLFWSVFAIIAILSTIKITNYWKE